MTILSLFLITGMTPDAIDAFWRAEMDFSQGKVEEAAQIYRDLTGSFRGTPFENELRFRLLETQLYTGDFEKVRREARDLLKRVRDTYLEPPTLVILGITYVFDRDTFHLRDVVERLKTYPLFEEYEGYPLIQGIYHYLAGDLEHAKADFMTVPTPLGQLLAARVMTELKEPRQALEIYQDLKGRLPGHLKALADYGMIETLLLFGDPSGAMLKAQDFLTSYTDHPFQKRTAFLLGVALFQKGDYEKAYVTLKTLAQDTQFSYAPYAAYFAGISRFHMERTDTTQVYALLQQARSYKKDALLNAMATVQMAEAAWANGDSSRVVAILQELPLVFALLGDGEMGNYIAAAVSREMERWDEAVRYADDLVKNGRPDHPLVGPGAALLLESLVASQPGEMATAAGRMYQRLLGEQSPLWNAYYTFALAEALFRVGSIAVAETLYRKVVDAEPPDPRLMGYARNGLAWCYLKEQRDGPAKETFLEVVRVAEDTSLLVQSYLGLGVAQFNLGIYDSAHWAFASAEQLAPKDSQVTPQALYYKGLAALALKYYGDAVRAWEKLVKTFPTSPRAAEAAFRSADIYTRAGKYQEARALLSWLMESHPNHPRTPEALFRLGQIYYNQRDFQAAIATYQKFIQLYPYHPLKRNVEQAMEQAYYALSSQDSIKVREFGKKFAQSELAAQALFDRASALYQAGNYVEAAKTFEQVALDFPKSTLAQTALMNAAKIYAAQSMWEEAASAYEKYLTFFSERREEALFGYGTALVQMGNYPKAVAVLETLREEFPDSDVMADAMRNLAVAYLRSGRTRDGIETLLFAADLYIQKGDTSQAQQLLQYAYHVAPDQELRQHIQSIMQRYGMTSQGG